MRLLRVVALTIAVLGCAAVASANTIWNFQNVTFNRPGFGTNTINGSFELSTGPSGLVAWDFTIGGTNTQANHHYLSGGANEGGIFGGPAEVIFFNFSLNPGVYVILDFVTSLTDAGGTVNIAATSLICPGCGTPVGGSVTTNSVGGAAVAPVPEPATLVLVGVGALFAATRLRRRQ